MTDRELLELAAKAAGLTVHAKHQASRDACGAGDVGLWISNESSCWNPLTDDGDALRLAVKCKIDVVQFSLLARADVAGLPDVREPYNGDPIAATRRAIVRAAAEIGRQMP